MIDTRTFLPKTAVVTGGSSGIGKEICLALAEAGLDIGFNYHEHEKEAAELASTIKAMGRKAFFRKADFAILPEDAEVVDLLIKDLGGIDVLVVNAGSSEPSRAIDFDFEKWKQTISVDLDAPMICMHKAAKKMKEQGRGGQIIAITSVHERVASPMSVAYTAAKHGLGGAVKALALELTPRYGITVNAVAPGEIATPMNKMEPEDATHEKNPREAVPAGRPGHPREIADVVAFLASKQSSFVTGASWTVDGGFEVMTPLALEQYRKEFLPKK